MATDLLCETFYRIDMKEEYRDCWVPFSVALDDCETATDLLARYKMNPGNQGIALRLVQGKTTLTVIA